MSKSKPSTLDRARVKFWSKRKTLNEFRSRVTQGNIAWTVFLIETLDYAPTQMIFDVRSWKGESTENLRNIAAVVQVLLKQLPQQYLPQKDTRPAIKAAFDHAILRSMPKPPRPKPGSPK